MGAAGLPPHPKKGAETGSLAGFLDEAGFSDRPSVRRTWSRRGVTPVIATAGGWKSRHVIGTIVATPKGRRPRFFASVRPKAVRSPDVVAHLRALRRHLGGRRLILLWDGLKAHTSRETRSYVESQSSWLAVERTPTYAPEVNPPEYGWSSMRAKDTANTCPATPADLDRGIARGVRRLKRNPGLLRGFLKASGLFS